MQSTVSFVHIIFEWVILSLKCSYAGVNSCKYKTDLCASLKQFQEVFIDESFVWNKNNLLHENFMFLVFKLFQIHIE